MNSSKKTWSVRAAKTQLSEILRLARAGKPQVIGTVERCVVVSEHDWRQATKSGDDLGRAGSSGLHRVARHWSLPNVEERAAATRLQ